MSAGTDGLGELGGPATRAGLVFSCFAAIGGQEYRCLVIAVMQARCECLVIILCDPLNKGTCDDSDGVWTTLHDLVYARIKYEIAFEFACTNVWGFGEMMSSGLAR